MGSAVTFVFQAADNQEGFVMCSAHHQEDHERVCEDQGNLKDQYGYYNDPESNPYTHYDTDRLTHSVGDDYCGLTIRVGFQSLYGPLGIPNSPKNAQRADILAPQKI